MDLWLAPRRTQDPAAIAEEDDNPDVSRTHSRGLVSTAAEATARLPDASCVPGTRCKCSLPVYRDVFFTTCTWCRPCDLLSAAERANVAVQVYHPMTSTLSRVCVLVLRTMGLNYLLIVQPSTSAKFVVQCAHVMRDCMLIRESVVCVVVAVFTVLGCAFAFCSCSFGHIFYRFSGLMLSTSSNQMAQ